MDGIRLDAIQREGPQRSVIQSNMRGALNAIWHMQPMPYTSTSPAPSLFSAAIFTE